MIGSSGSILGPALVTLFNSSMDARSIFLIAVGVVLLTTLIVLTYPVRGRHPTEESSPDGRTGKRASSHLLKQELAGRCAGDVAPAWSGREGNGRAAPRRSGATATDVEEAVSDDGTGKSGRTRGGDDGVEPVSDEHSAIRRPQMM